MECPPKGCLNIPWVNKILQALITPNAK